ncbi:resistance transporter, EmrB/QacA subfamily protein, partial [mine drainage metagenome]
GVLISSAGMALVSYGVIQAGQQGWGDARAIAALVLGAAGLAGFVFWERRVPEPLIDLGLFRSAGFTWGTLLATIVSFAMFGVLFAVPQYFQEIRGVSALGSGLRLLPLIGGLIVGAGIATKLAQRAGAKIAVALGYALLAGGLVMVSGTRIDTG